MEIQGAEESRSTKWRDETKREKSSTFVNFHPVEFSKKKKKKNHDVDVATDSIKLRRA